jgi:hypothetical protein
VDAQAELSQRLVEDGLASRYHLVSSRLRLGFSLGEGVPAALELEGVVNAGARGPGARRPLGAVVAFVIGSASRAGRGEVAFEIVAIGADATLDLFSRDLWGTNVVGAGTTAAFVPWQGLTVGFEFFLSEALDPALRTRGQARGEYGGPEATAMQVHLTGEYDF